MAAYQALGQFITTFADSINSGFTLSETGELVEVENKTESERSASMESTQNESG